MALLPALLFVVVVGVALQFLNWYRPSEYSVPFYDVRHVETHAHLKGPVADQWYDVAPVSAPRLVGWPLRIFSRVIIQWPFSTLLSNFLILDNKFHFVSDFSARLPLSVFPSFYPAPFLSVSENASLASLASSADVSKEQLLETKQTTRDAGGKWAKLSDGWVWNTVDDYVAGYKSGAFTPSDVVHAVLAAVEHSNRERKLFAVTQTNISDALAQAKESERRYAAGQARRLEGVPVAVKEEAGVYPYKTTVGTTLVAHYAGKHNEATAVQRLRDAGAIVIGVTNMHEIGLGTTGANPHFSLPRNAADPTRYPGGSSSGSGAAVGAGLVPIALGLDGGGSIRIPAAFNGVVGLKATFGRISEAGNFPLCWTVGHIGPLTRSVHDTALAYAILASPPADSRDHYSHDLTSVHFSGYHKVQDLSGVRIGIYSRWFDDSDEDIRKACRAALKDLTTRGAELVSINALPHLMVQQMAHAITITVEMALAMEPYFHTAANLTQFNPETIVSLSLARAFTGRHYVGAQRIRTYASQLWDAIFDAYDLDAFVTPATATRPPVIEEDAEEAGESNLAVTTKIMRYAFVANLIGTPAISVPIYPHDDSAAPIGLQFMAEHYREDVLIRLAAAVEDITLEKYADKLKKPQVYYDIIKEAKKLNQKGKAK